jgi:hypothetical protein
VISVGAVPVWADTLKKLALLKVLPINLQFKVPVPPLPICITWDGGRPPGFMEKLNCPGVLSNTAPPGGATTKVTWTMSEVPPPVNTTSPE